MQQNQPLTFVDDICRHLGVRPNDWNVKNLKEGAVGVPLLAVDVLDHHVGGQHLDELHRICSLVLLLAVLQAFVEVRWKRPETIGVDESNDIPIGARCNVVRLKQRPGGNYHIRIVIE